MHLINVARRLNRDSIPHYSRVLLQRIYQFISTIQAYMSATWWNVIIGKGNKFVGGVSFSRTRGSTIIIGQHGRFLSSTTANRHGLNRPCMISTLRPNAVIKIGNAVGLSGAVICAAKQVQIGDRVMLGANVTVTDTDSHPVDYKKRLRSDQARLEDHAVSVRSVLIENDVFIGMHSLILKGVTIGEGAVIGAGSVVATSIPPHCVAAGNPAKVIRYLSRHNETIKFAVHEPYDQGVITNE